MNSTLVPFDEILENLRDDTGITYTSNMMEKIRRWIFRAEQKLGYNGAQVFKKVTYVIDTVNWTGKTLQLPSDCLFINDIYIDDARINNHKYRQYGNRITFVDDHSEKTSLRLYYYGIMHDAEGNPATPRDHAEALNKFLIWKLFGAKAFLDPNRRSRNLVKSYEEDWDSARDACHGNQAFPQNIEEMEIFSGIMNFSSMEAIVYYPNGDCPNDAVMESKETCVLKKEEIMINVYAWQFPDTVSNISLGPNVSQEYLDQYAEKHDFLTFKEGLLVPYTKIGRIAFAVQGGTASQYGFFDIFNSDITGTVFHKYYNPILKLDIYISKEFYSHSNIFFKIKEL